MKKALRETQTLRAGCSKAEPKISAPPQTPFPGAQDSQNLISWRWSLPSPTDPVWWRSMHAISSYRGNRPANKHTNTHANRQDWLQYTAPLSLARSVNIDRYVGGEFLSGNCILQYKCRIRHNFFDPHIIIAHDAQNLNFVAAFVSPIWRGCQKFEMMTLCP